MHLNFKRSLKYMAIVFLVLIAGLVVLVLNDPKLCNDEYLRHTFDRRVLVTPVNSITDEESETIRWGVEYSGFSDKLYEYAYLTPKNRKIIRIHPYARPALTIGFHIGVVIDSPGDRLEIESSERFAKIEIADEPNVKVGYRNADRPISLHDGHRGKYFKYSLEFHVRNETIERLYIEDGDTFSGNFRFVIDGEPYSFAFSSKLRYERRKRSCFGVPGMP